MALHVPRHLTRTPYHGVSKNCVSMMCHEPQVLRRSRPSAHSTGWIAHERQQQRTADERSVYAPCFTIFCLASRAVEPRHPPKNPVPQRAARSSNAASRCQPNWAYRAMLTSALQTPTAMFSKGSTLPRTDLPRMHAVLLRQLRKGQLLTDRLKCNFRFELRRMVLSLRHFGSSFSSADPS